MPRKRHVGRVVQPPRRIRRVPRESVTVIARFTLEFSLGNSDDDEADLENAVDAYLDQCAQDFTRGPTRNMRGEPGLYLDSVDFT